MARSKVKFIIYFAILLLYCHTARFLASCPELNKVHQFYIPKLSFYGFTKFFWYQNVIIQLVNAFSHLLAYIDENIRPHRDLWFSSLAFPIGISYTISFWFVWFLMGRSYIFPGRLDMFFPNWLFHVMHTLPLPICCLYAAMSHHESDPDVALVTETFFFISVGYIYYIRYATGIYVYPFLDTMNGFAQTFYWLLTGALTYMMFVLAIVIDCAFYPHLIRFFDRQNEQMDMPFE